MENHKILPFSKKIHSIRSLLNKLFNTNQFLYTRIPIDIVVDTPEHTTTYKKNSIVLYQLEKVDGGLNLIIKDPKTYDIVANFMFADYQELKDIGWRIVEERVTESSSSASGDQLIRIDEGFVSMMMSLLRVELRTAEQGAYVIFYILLGKKQDRLRFEINKTTLIKLRKFLDSLRLDHGH